MIEHLPWVLALLVLAAAVGYAVGRRASAPAMSAEPSTGAPAAGAAPRSAARPASGPASASPRAPEQGAIPPLSGVASWGYQLQSLDLKRAAASPFDLLVIDYAKDGTDDTALKPGEVERLKTKPDGSRRIVVAYVSIGEAESYRAYWQKSWKRQPPEWLLGENPEWEENYSVCFWHQDWQELFIGNSGAYIDRIIAQGFDGIYLDKCDVTEDLREHFKAVARSRPRMDDDMAAFVRRISAYAKAKRPGFHIIMQNAEPLLERAELRAAIDAVAKEELLFGLDRPEQPNAADDIAWSRKLLDLARRDGKPIFVVEYLDAQARRTEATETIHRLGYVPYMSPKDRELATLDTRQAVV